jgi:alpha-glucuronidase
MRAKLCTLLVLVTASGLHAETGRAAWLRYAAAGDASARQYRESIPAVVVSLGDAAPLDSARRELVQGIRGMIGRTLRVESRVPGESAIVLGTLGAIRQAFPQLDAAASLEPDGYWLKTLGAGAARYTIVTAANDRGVLYGTFALLRKIALGEPVGGLDEKQSPFAAVRWVNQWDNLDGSIERGYGGRSIFWENGHVREDLTRAGEYARLLASVGINGCSINNVNANPRILASDFVPQVARIAAAFRPWGVQVALSVDFGSPKTIGGLDTFDPADPRVAAWWKSTVDQIYRAIPDLAGFVLKADSEGRVGPSAYGRTHADAANMVARALQPHGGLLFYRGFVYDHHMDWRNPKNDRARAAYDNFKQLDGQFDGNVVIQIKNGPIDFQVREPASPLFGALEKTSQAVELQITQEYMGQARHDVFLVPMWKETLDFDLHAGPAPTPVKALVAGKVFHRPAGGLVGVANVGLDENWAGNHLSMANLYGFGRLAWDADLSARRLAEEWTRLTFGDDPKVVETVVGTQLSSWRTYENYTGPLGLQTLTDITGDHYGVAVEASERNGWGQWHNADEKGAGMDRTVATGTGFIGQYHPAVAGVYESLATCPDDLLLFLHHVPYTYRLHSGKTVIQYIYDSHYEGADAVAAYVDAWKPLQGRVDDQRYGEVLAQLEYQAGHAQVWRDAVTSWFLRASGIPDAQGRVGRYPGRVEAESMALQGYTVQDVAPWEAASGGKAVVCSAAQCAATLRFDGAPGWYALRVQYFDMPAGVSRFRVLVANQAVDEWAAADHLPARKIDASASVRRVIPGIALRAGDEIRIEGVPDARDPAALDYIEIDSLPVAATANWTAEEDHRNMMEQLGIVALRPGPSGTETAPNHANYDESKANPFPNLPDPLTLKNGRKVTTAQVWWDERRPEIVEDFEREVVGRVPKNVPKVTWTVTGTVNGTPGAHPIVTRQLVGHVDNSSYPAISVDIRLTLVTPSNVRGPVPVMMMFGFGGMPPAPAPGADPPAAQQLIADGWGYATIVPASIQADNGAGLTKGIIGLVNQGQPRKPDDWGALRAWAWGAGRALDYLETDPAVDAKHVGIEGVSRYGKAALVTMAFDTRFAVVLVGSSGEGGAKLHRRNWGEAVENLTGSGEFHWMAGNFLKYGAAEAAFGSKNAGDLPVDAHELIALCAPRPTFISYGVPEKGDAKWLDQQGSYMAAVAAGPVFKLLGAKDLGTTDDYRIEKMPAVNVGLLDGQLAWRQHDGGHTDGPNWKYFIPWADRLIRHTPPPDEPVARTDQNSLTAHAQLLEKAGKGRIDIYFEGDSITRRWGATDYPDLLANWNRNFFGWNAADFGWGADTIQNILWRLDHGELDGVNPRIIVLLAGTNNVGNMAPPADVTSGIQAILRIMETKAPGATIVLTAIFPRNDNLAMMPAIHAINDNLSKLADGKKIRFLNVNDKLADQDGKLFDGMMNAGDKLHPAIKGYQVWADKLKPIFSELLGPPAKEDHAPPPTGDPSARR